MVETIKLEKNILRKKLEENLKTRMAVYIYIYIVYCHLEKKIVLICRYLKSNNRIRDRTILKMDINRKIIFLFYV